mmetsp:Transcript_11205/g.26347  ORF Transcript_11205/g.26347 Transcript_11205/m.26347 type:complete len:247 (-) Transcript_11205:101-841(-)
MVHLDVKRRRGSGRVLHLRPGLDDPRELTGLLLLEGVNVVVGHALGGDDDLLRSVDNEVSALVVDALSKVGELRVVLVGKDAEERPKHDGNVTQELLPGHLGLARLAQILGGVTNVGVVPAPVLVHGDVDVEGGRVRQVPEAGLVRENIGHRAVLLDRRRLGQIDLPEADLKDLLGLRGRHVVKVLFVIADQMLQLRRDPNVAGIVHQLLHRVLDELIKRVQLLPHQTLLSEICTDNRPRVLLGDR